jgi:TolB-like protein
MAGAELARPDQVRAELDRIVGSSAFAGSDQLKRLLRAIVERTLAGEPEALKEYTLGLDVFQRPPDYDPKVDPIVRVQARRLRSKLDEYYAGEGASSSVFIRIPKGAYVPAFEPRAVPPSRRRWWIAAGLCATLALAATGWWYTRGVGAAPVDVNRSIAVLPLKMFSNEPNRRHTVEQATEVLTTELARNTRLRVVSRTTASTYGETTARLPEIAGRLRARWIVEGGVGFEGGRTYVKLRTVDSVTDRKIWADVFDCDVSELVTANSKAASGIASAIETALAAER